MLGDTCEVCEAVALECQLHSHFVTDDILHGVDAVLGSVLYVHTLLLQLSQLACQYLHVLIWAVLALGLVGTM